MQFLGALRLYKPDVLILAIGVTLLTSLLKNTLLKNCNKKLFFFLPFAIGPAVYAGYKMIATASVCPVTGTLALTLEGGFACGCAATLYYIVYEQFFRKKQSQNPLYPLLEGLVPDDKKQEAADLLYQAGQEQKGDELKAFCDSLLTEYSPELSDAERTAAVAAVCSVLDKLFPSE